MSHLIIVGDIVVDVTLKTLTEPYKLRLGGITHSARAAWALDAKYSVGYFSPSYMEGAISEYYKRHGCLEEQKLGDVIGAPYVFLISEAKEVGEQGYEFLFRDKVQLVYSEKLIKANSESEVLFISGNYNVRTVLEKVNSKNSHIDLANNVQSLDEIKQLGYFHSTIFISTSSNLFKCLFEGDFRKFAENFKPYCARLILKENRGGSRGIDFNTNEIVAVPSQTQIIVHSVGVGDAFDAAYVIYYRHYTFREALTLSSWVACEYALTTFPDDFRMNIQRIKKCEIKDLIGLGGVSLPWEKRKQVNVYIAAPDFDFLDTSEIDRVSSSLEYHNFSPRRPIRENGQMEINANIDRKKELFQKDMTLIDQCQIIVAVLLNNDSGTLVEIGYAVGIGKPAIVYDPYDLAKNCMLSELPTLVSNNLDNIICEVFKQSAKIV